MMWFMNFTIFLQSHEIKWFEEGHKAGIQQMDAPDSN